MTGPLITEKWLPGLRTATPLVVLAVLTLLPAPQGLPVNAWRYFALFAAVIVGTVLEPVPIAVISLAAVVAAAALGLVGASTAEATSWALGGFSNSVVWLIFAAYMFALGYSKTGLGKRIALVLIRIMGKRILGLGYAIALADLALAPFTPSNTARSGGTIYPIICNIPDLYVSRSGGVSSQKIGAYLMYTALAVQCVTSSMFLTALAPNLLAVSLAAKIANATISWMDWFKGFAPAGITLFILVPILVYKIHPPEFKETPDAPRWASEELRKMGPVTGKEVKLLVLAILALVLWVGAAKQIDTTLTAVLMVVLMVLLGVVSWTEVIGNGPAWNALIWFGTLVTLAGGLVETKFVDWLARSVTPIFSALDLIPAMVLLLGVFFFVHYLFASISAHTTALIPAFLTVAAKIPGISPTAWALLLGYTLGLMGILTPYATGPSPIYYGCGYIKGKDFWLWGLILGLLFFLVYVAIIPVWLAFLKI